MGWGVARVTGEEVLLDGVFGKVFRLLFCNVAPVPEDVISSSYLIQMFHIKQLAKMHNTGIRLRSFS